jgi:hypothetical protein
MVFGPPFNLRIPPSGPNVLGPSGSPALHGNVLTVSADGLSVFFAPGGSGTVDASEVVNDSAAPGPSVADALDQITTAPSFPPESDAGNVTGATNISVGISLARKFTLTGNATVTVINLVVGRAQWFQFTVVQGAGGSKTLAIAGAKTPGGAGLPLSTVAGSVDLVSGYWDGIATIRANVGGLGYA